MNICVISGGYPYYNRPEYHFVEQLCGEWSKQGHRICVISPQSVTKNLIRKLPEIPYHRTIKYGDNFLEVISPKFISLGNIGNKIPFVKYSFRNSVEKALKTMDFIPDIIYGHFWHNAYASYRYAKANGIPIIVASGEAEIEQTVNTLEEKEFTEYVKGVICVSTKNLNESIKKQLTVKEKCIVLPNAIDEKLFYYRDKIKCRQEIGVSKDDFIVCFVGGMIPRKGPDRVSAAVTQINDLTIKSFFIGANKDGAPIKPTCDGILHYGKLEHDLIPLYLCASDVFVLPTLYEGCCNAIVEAMACGLPVVSSNREFNFDILDSSNSIMVDPMDIDAISNAIVVLKNNRTYRNKLSEGSLLKAGSLRISCRAENIIKFIQSRISNS